jgi:hypothetical protein
MTAEEESKNILLCESLGWRRVRIHLAGPRWVPPGCTSCGLAATRPLPAHFTDMNAIRNAVAGLCDNRLLVYLHNLLEELGHTGILGGWKMTAALVKAEPRQCAEALCRTLKIK